MGRVPRPSAGIGRQHENHQSLASFIKADHRYVYLGTSVIAALGLAFSQRNPTPMSFLAPGRVPRLPLGNPLGLARRVGGGAGHQTHALERLSRKVAVRIRALPSWRAPGQLRRGRHRGDLFVDRCVMSFIDLVQVSIVSDSNPSDFLSSLVYMTYKSGDFFIRGIEITIALATFGTVIAFSWRCFRVPAHPDVRPCGQRSPRFFKSIGRGFATVYSTIVRGTP
ncbi:MAG: hypothetical protein ACLU0O_04075 [Collinsella sp.]